MYRVVSQSKKSERGHIIHKCIDLEEAKQEANQFTKQYGNTVCVFDEDNDFECVHQSMSN